MIYALITLYTLKITYKSKMKQYVRDVDNYIEIARQFYNPSL